MGKNTEKRDLIRDGSRLLRVGFLTFTMAGPVVNTLLEQMRNRSQAMAAQTAVLKDTARQNWDDGTFITQKVVAEQAQQLQKQARQLQKQARLLRKALRKEVRQRKQFNKLNKKLLAAGIDVSHELRKRGETLTENIVEQSSKLTDDLAKRTGKVTHDLAERSSQVSQDLLQRGSKLSHDLAERSSQLTQDLVERSSQTTRNLTQRTSKALQPSRERNRTLLAVLGFLMGLGIAGALTYIYVRRNMVQEALEDESQPIELPQETPLTSVSTARPAGEIRTLEEDGVAVATLPTVDVAQNEIPADATIVGVVSSKLYYPVSSTPDGTELVYFATEEEARTAGYNPAG